MAERKVLGKYYPPDFDPSALVRKRGPKQVGPKVQPVRLMAPFSMKCTSCGEYIYKGRKFNARKETPQDFVYLGVQRFRFYIKCTRCSAEIIFATDPAVNDYVMIRGAKRNMEPWRPRAPGADADADETDEQRVDRLEREEAAALEDEERNAMQELEAETVDARREMAVADALDEIRTRNARLERAVDRDGLDALVGRGDGAADEDAARARQDREDEEAARRAFAAARRMEALEVPMDEDGGGEEVGGAAPAGVQRNGESSGSGGSDGDTTPIPAPESVAKTEAVPVKEPAVPSFKRQVKKKKDRATLLGIKKKPALV